MFVVSSDRGTVFFSIIRFSSSSVISIGAMLVLTKTVSSGRRSSKLIVLVMVVSSVVFSSTSPLKTVVSWFPTCGNLFASASKAGNRVQRGFVRVDPAFLNLSRGVLSERNPLDLSSLFKISQGLEHFKLVARTLRGSREEDSSLGVLFSKV